MTTVTAVQGNSMISQLRKGLLASFVLGTGMLFAACSGSSSSGSPTTAGAMTIVSCSLSCGGGSGGTQISCGLNQVAVNETLVIDFSQPVDLSTVDKTTFQVTDIATGKSPLGTFSLAPGNPNRLLFRPLLTFNASGNPIYGFEQLHSYQILIRGTSQDSGGSYVSAVGGKKNVSRMFCTVASSGILDPVPGPPVVTVSVDVVTATDPITGEVTETMSQVASGGAFLQNVASDTTIRFHFDDVMNPATLVNPVTGESATIRVSIDPDGDTNDVSDQVEVFGDYTIILDEVGLVTDVEFTPSGGLPSSGSGAQPRVIVIDLPSSISDLGANPLLNAGNVIFVPQAQTFDPVVLPGGGETFTTTALRDGESSGALWGGGALLRSKGGGSGRLGALIVKATNSPVTLDTDSHVFSGSDVIPEGSGAFPPSATPPTTTVTGGVFEFSKIVIESGSVLKFTGSNPARLFARGLAHVRGSSLIDIGGRISVDDTETSPIGHNSTNLAGGPGGIAGPGGGTGGAGGDRPNDVDVSLLIAGGSPNPGAVIDGTNGGGVGGLVGIGSGQGGSTWPAAPPTNTADIVGYFMGFDCKLGIVSGPGSGGAYATAGFSPTTKIVNPGFYNLGIPGLYAPVTPGGDDATVGLDAASRTLDPNLGFLRGGSGGGGGALQYIGTRTDGAPNPFGSCTGSTIFTVYTPQSGAGGGGGGGALQLHAGSEVRLDGSILASGGYGGSNQNGFASLLLTDQASPGGGGSGGAVLLQAPNIQLAEIPGRIDISGGRGGIGPGSLPGTKGGNGGVGLIRLESGLALNPALVAEYFVPYDATPGSVTGGAASTNVLSTGNLAQGFSGPEGRSGAQSCWIIPNGNFFVLDFQDDDLTDPLNLDLGWDAQVILTVAGVPPFSYRDSNDPNIPLGTAPEILLGSDLGGATPGAIVIRFQGIHAIKEVNEACDLDVVSLGGSVDPQSLTPWLRNPAELNTYWSTALPGQVELAAKRRPNMFRYQVIFDGEALNANLIAGITNLYVKATPD